MKAYQKEAIKLASELLSEMDWGDYPAPRWCALKRIPLNCYKNKLANCKGCQWLK